MLIDYPELLLIFFGIAILYSSIGFGGGSSYIALLVLFGVDYLSLRVIALLCNIIVVSFGTYYFYKLGFLNVKKILPLVALSIPFAFLGGRIQLEQALFLFILGLSLLLAGLLIFFKKEEESVKEKKNKLQVGLNGLIGGGIGFLSGLVGIGGGIFLSPVLHLMRWDKAKSIAAAASFFILVNSLAGLLGRFSKIQDFSDWNLAIGLAASVLLGGQIGTRLGAKVFSEIVVRRLTAVLIFYVGLKLVLENGLTL